MQQLWPIYHNEIPTFIQEFSQTKPMMRLKDIGMNCGCEYTQFPLFKTCQPYSRYDHSIGVALIIWHFTGDYKQTIAGLLHDIATPVFAHTIDFLHGDYEKQESTEENTEMVIRSSSEIMHLLECYQLDIDDVANYHLYPIADNDLPLLSADRLEYFLGNMLNYDFCDIQTVKQIYHDLMVDNNELVLKNSYVYVSNEDRFAMQALADIVQFAITQQIITHDDLYQNETYIINQLCSQHQTKELWQQYTHYSKIYTSEHQVNENYRQIHAKKRYIDPFIKDQGRVSQLCPSIYQQIQTFLQLSFDHYILAK